jgi:TRAP transporter TAXI family solute receptor
MNEDGTATPSQPRKYILGTSTDGSISFAIGQQLQKLIRNNSDRTRLTAQATPGAKVNYRLFDDGEVDAFVADNVTYKQARNDEGPFADKPVDQVPPQGFIQLSLDVYAIARNGTGIQTLDDMAGNRVWLFWPGSAIRSYTKDLYTGFGLWDQVTLRDMSPTDVPGAMSEGRLDAIGTFGISGRTIGGWTQQIDKQVDVHALTMSDEKVTIVKEFPGLQYRQLDAYGWQQNLDVDKIDSYSVPVQYFFGRQMPEAVVYDIAKTTYENADGLVEALPAASDISKPEVLTSAVLPDEPIHPGVAKLFKELDIWNEDWTVASLA